MSQRVSQNIPHLTDASRKLSGTQSLKSTIFLFGVGITSVLFGGKYSMCVLFSHKCPVLEWAEQLSTIRIIKYSVNPE